MKFYRWDELRKHFDENSGNVCKRESNSTFPCSKLFIMKHSGGSGTLGLRPGSYVELYMSRT